MKQNHPYDKNKKWRNDAKSILKDLRKFQDAITQNHGFEGFSFVCVRINRLTTDSIEEYEYRAEPGFCVVSRLIDGQVVETFNSEIPKD